MYKDIWVNVTTAERSLRTIVALAAILYFLILPSSPLFIAWSSLVSVYLLMTSLVAWDPIYSMLYKLIGIIDSRLTNPKPELQNEFHFAS